MIHINDIDENVIEQLMLAAGNGNVEAMFELGFVCFHGYGVIADYGRAREYFMQAADLGHGEAMYNVGAMYRLGHGVPPDDMLANEWMERAANAGFAAAMGSMGHIYDKGLGVPQDYMVAGEWFKKAAAAGDVYSQNVLGAYYQDGLAGEQDDAKALEWYRRAAEQGEPLAQNNLGHMYFNGKGAARDMREVERWWRKAAENGVDTAQYNLGCLYMGDFGPLLDAPDCDAALYWLQKAALGGYAQAYYALGQLFFNGLSRYVTEALGETKALNSHEPDMDVLNGNAELEFVWACKYELGAGVSADYTKAGQLFQQAAEHGHEAARCLCNGMYAERFVVYMDLYRQAAEMGLVAAMRELGLAYLYGNHNVLSNYEEAEKWLRRAAQQGDASSQGNLGVMYRDGKRVERDLVKAAAWFMVAWDNGDEDAERLLHRMAAANDMSDEQLEEAKALTADYA